jgi:hypothetical protein
MYKAVLFHSIVSVPGDCTVVFIHVVYAVLSVLFDYLLVYFLFASFSLFLFLFSLVSRGIYVAKVTSTVNSYIMCAYEIIRCKLHTFVAIKLDIGQVQMNDQDQAAAVLTSRTESPFDRGRCILRARKEVGD